jgi:hypothetical protein
MRKFFAVAMGSVVALAGFASMANASATVDLIWIDVTNTDTAGNPICLRPAQRNCPQLGSTISSVAVTDSITLSVIITAGPNGILGAGVDVDYSDGQPKISVSAFQSLTTTKPFFYLPSGIGTTDGSVDGWVQLIAATAIPILDPPLGLGMPPGATAYLGTVSFHKDQLINGTFDIAVGVNGPNGASDVLDIAGNNISATTDFNGATLLNVPEPGALSLLVMGLGGMLLAGRGRRS